MSPTSLVLGRSYFLPCNDQILWVWSLIPLDLWNSSLFPPDSLPKVFLISDNASQCHTPDYCLRLWLISGLLLLQVHIMQIQGVPFTCGGWELHPLSELKQCSAFWLYAVPFSPSLDTGSFLNFSEHRIWWAVIFKQIYWLVLAYGNPNYNCKIVVGSLYTSQKIKNSIGPKA